MYSSPESGSASRNVSSVVPGLPNRWRTPLARRISMSTAATFMRADPLLRSLALPAHHVTRDVEAEASGGGVTRVRDLVAGLALDVGEAVVLGPEAEPGPRALHPVERLGLIGGKAIERGHLGGHRERGQLAPLEGLHLVADLVDRDRRRPGAQPPDTAHREQHDHH